MKTHFEPVGGSVLRRTVFISLHIFKKLDVFGGVAPLLSDLSILVSIIKCTGNTLKDENYSVQDVFLGHYDSSCLTHPYFQVLFKLFS